MTMSALQWIGKLTVVDALGWTLVHSLWQGLAIGVVLAIVLRAMKSRSASARYVVAIAGMSLIPACAITTFGLLIRQAEKMTAHLNDVAPVLIGANGVDAAISARLISP